MIDDIKRIELEITSSCNAACPGCARTIHRDKLEINRFTLQDLQRMFPDRRHIEDKEFKFCGVLGDPADNTDAVDMTEYLINNNGDTSWSTNGACQNTEWWTRLGKLSASTNRLNIHFCVDGHKETNHIYRVNTKWNVLERNMQAYSDAGGKASWIYIVFDHNEHELDAAKAHAEKLGFRFATRTGYRNSQNNWVAKLGKKNNKQEKIITTTGSKEHSKKKIIEELDKFIIKEEKTDAEIKEITDTIVCRYVHEQEIFISSKQELWPCCYLWDSAFKLQDGIKEKLNYSPGWNSLKQHSIEEILQHPWYKEVLEESWNSKHPKHFKRCIRTCAKNKAYHNETKYE